MTDRIMVLIVRARRSIRSKRPRARPDGVTAGSEPGPRRPVAGAGAEVAHGPFWLADGAAG
jgi:hypothetical protein